MNVIHKQVMIAIAHDECIALDDDANWEACFGVQLSPGEREALEAWGTIRVTVVYNDPPAPKWEPLPPYEGLTLHDM